MKKRFALVFVVLALSIVGMILAKDYQRKIASNDIHKNIEVGSEQNSTKVVSASTNSEIDNKEQKDDIKKSDNTSEQKDVKVQNENNSSTVKSLNNSAEKKATSNKSNKSNVSKNESSSNTNSQNSKKNLPDNFIVMDEVNNKVLISTRVNFNGRNVADITKDTLSKLNIKYRYNEGYFSSINNINAGSLNPKSDGWCYFVGEKKPSIGSADFIPQDDDKVLWKYVKDGTKP